MDDSHSKNKDLEERPGLLSICSQPFQFFSIDPMNKDQKQREQLSFGHKGEIEMEKERYTKIYAAFAGKTKQELFELFHASANGLTEEQIERSRENYGENAISYGKTPFIVEILKAYITPFTLVLIALGIISFITEYVLAAPGDKDLFGVAIIFTMVIVSGTMTLIQSVRSNQAAEN